MKKIKGKVEQPIRERIEHQFCFITKISKIDKIYVANIYYAF